MKIDHNYFIKKFRQMSDQGLVSYADRMIEATDEISQEQFSELIDALCQRLANLCGLRRSLTSPLWADSESKEKYANETDAELIQRWNKEAQKRGWATARANYIAEMSMSLSARGISDDDPRLAQKWGV